MPAGERIDVLRLCRERLDWLDRCLKRTEEMQELIRDWLTLAEAEGGSSSSRVKSTAGSDMAERGFG